MSLIEQAAKHLEGLRANQDVPANASPPAISLPSPAVTNPPSLIGSMGSRQVTLDLEKLAESGFITPDGNGSLLVDEFRVLKRPLLTNAAGRSMKPIRNANLIMITSALPKEGKTFTAVNLAMSIAMELDRHVLLVDADVARPALPQLLNQPGHKGLLDVLENPALHLSDVMLRTNVEKLSLLMAGSHHPHATELLASQAMATLLDEMAHRYSDRIIIFDSPPLLVTTEARVLATHMGQIVFVVKAEETLQSAVKEAIATIAACPVKMLILNQAQQAGPQAYGYGYGYGR